MMMEKQLSWFFGEKSIKVGQGPLALQQIQDQGCLAIGSPPFDDFVFGHYPPLSVGTNKHKNLFSQEGVFTAACGKMSSGGTFMLPLRPDSGRPPCLDS